MSRSYYLVAKYDTRASFYNKALVEVNDNGEKVLKSYNTKVCTIKGDKFQLNGAINRDLLFSNTTLRHIKEFLRQELGIENLTKKDLEKTL